MRLYSAADAATYLGITTRRVTALCETGRLGQKVGRQWIITHDELERFAQLERPAGVPVDRHPSPRKHK